MNLPDTVTVITEGTWTEDGEGNAIRSAGASVTYRGHLYRQTATETQGRQTVETIHEKLMLPLGTPIGANDRVSVNGRVFEVDGEPYVAHRHHVEVNLRRG